MPRIKGIFIDRKAEEDNKLCDACEKPRSVLITIGENYIRICKECAAAISEKLQKSLESEPLQQQPKQEKGAGKFSICAYCMEVTETGKSHKCKKLTL